MASIKLCPVCPHRWHVVSDQPDRHVCAADRAGLKYGIRQGVQLGLISQADYKRLLEEVALNLAIPEDCDDACGTQACGYNHTFVIGLFDTLDVMCGTGNPHPDDVQ